MNKLIILAFILISPYILYAEDNFGFNFNIATTGVGINYSSNDDDSLDLFAELLTVGVEHKYTNIGIGFSPFKYWYFWRGDEPDDSENEEKVSFLNFNINWNILDRKNIFLGPFGSINYMFLENGKMRWNEFIFTGGIRFIWSFNIFKDDILYHFISSEIGYRNINGTNKFYFSMSIDLITLLYSVAYYGGGYGIVNNNKIGKSWYAGLTGPAGWRQVEQVILP